MEVKKKSLKRRLKKIKEIKWLIPGWAGYEYYKVHKKKGVSKGKSALHGAKAEALRIGTTAAFPVPGTYETTTVGLAKLKKKIEKGEIDEFTLKGLRRMSADQRKILLKKLRRRLLKR